MTFLEFCPCHVLVYPLCARSGCCVSDGGCCFRWGFHYQTPAVQDGCGALRVRACVQPPPCARDRIPTLPWQLSITPVLSMAGLVGGIAMTCVAAVLCGACACRGGRYNQIKHNFPPGACACAHTVAEAHSRVTRIAGGPHGQHHAKQTHDPPRSATRSATRAVVARP